MVLILFELQDELMMNTFLVNIYGCTSVVFGAY